MPIHLLPLSRRHFIRGAVAAGAGLLAGGRTATAVDAPPVDPHFWALLADPHIAADPRQTGRGKNVSEQLILVREDLLALDARPAGLIVHGDCAFSSGQSGDYRRLLRLLRPVRERNIPIHLALGNHDHRERFVKAVQPQPSLVAEKQVAVVEAERANFFILDSLNGIASNPGWLGPDQLAWLSESLDARPEKPAIVVVHHNPPKLVDSDALVEMMDARPHVKALFYGHRHNWGLGETPGGVHLVNLLPVSYPQAGQEQTGPTGWVRAELWPDRVQLEIRCSNAEHELHLSRHELVWRSDTA